MRAGLPRAPALGFAVALAVLVLAGCLEPRSQPSPPAGGDDAPRDEDPAPPADDGDDVGNGTGEDMTLRIEPATAVVTDVTTWRLVLTVRERTGITHRGCPPELLDGEIVAGEDRVQLYTYGEEGMAGLCALRPMTLEPGTYERNVSWNGRREPAAPDPHTGDRLPPGTYTLEARLGATDRDVRATASVVVAAQG